MYLLWMEYCVFRRICPVTLWICVSPCVVTLCWSALVSFFCLCPKDVSRPDASNHTCLPCNQLDAQRLTSHYASVSCAVCLLAFISEAIFVFGLEVASFRPSGTVLLLIFSNCSWRLMCLSEKTVRIRTGFSLLLLCHCWPSLQQEIARGMELTDQARKNPSQVWDALLSL